jgi:hypothetical protein
LSTKISIADPPLPEIDSVDRVDVVLLDRIDLRRTCFEGDVGAGAPALGNRYERAGAPAGRLPVILVLGHAPAEVPEHEVVAGLGDHMRPASDDVVDEARPAARRDHGRRRARPRHRLDMAQLYRGSLALTRSDLGGLCATLDLPAPS